MESYQITLVGDSLVGKTCVISSYIRGNIPSGYEPTLFEKHVHGVDVDGETYNLEIFDNTGQKSDRLRPLSYIRTNCFVICFSLFTKSSYQSVIDNWSSEIKHFKPKIPILLVGTKSDLRNDANVQVLKMEDGYKLKDMIRAEKYLECSSVTREGIEDVFREAVRAILNKKQTKRRICSII